MASTDSTIRIALELAAMSSGMGAFTGVTGALSSLLSTTILAGGAAEQLSASLLKQEDAARALELAQSRLANAQTLTGNASTVVESALIRQEIAQSNLEQAEKRYAASAKTQNDERLLQIAQQRKALADLSVDSAENSLINQEAAEKARVATAENTLALAQERQAVADLNVTQAQAAVTAEQAALSTQMWTAAFLAAAAEAVIFDLSLKSIIDTTGHLQLTTAQMDLALHGSREEIAALNPEIIKWADASLYSTAQVHEMVTTLSEHGMTVKTIMDGAAQSAINLGEAIKSDPVPAADLLASAMQVFSSEGLTATDAANVLTAAFYNGIPSASDLQGALEMVGGQAATMGVSIKDLSATLDLLAQAGMSGTSAATSLRYMLQTLDNPTKKAADDLNFLGITVVNTTNPAFEHLKEKLDASGKAGQAAVTNFDGTSAGLRNMYTEAQKLGLIPLNETFNYWATSTGAMSSKLFDAQGQFVGMGNAVQTLIDSVKAKAKGNPELMAELLGDLFNVRSGRAVQLLTNMSDFKDKYNTILGEMGSTSAASDAQKLLQTLPGAAAELQTTMTSFGAAMGAPMLAPLISLIQHLNDFLNWLMVAHPHLVQFLGVFIAVGAVVATTTAVILGAVVVFALLATIVGGSVAAGFGIVLLAIPLIASGIALLVANWQSMIAFFQPAITLIGNVFHILGTVVHDALNQPWIGQMRGALGSLQDAFDNLGKAIEPYMPLLSSLGQAFLYLVAAIGIVVGAILVGLVTAVAQGLNFLVNGVAMMLTGLTQFFVSAWALFLDMGHLIVAVFEMIFSSEPQKAQREVMAIMGKLGTDLLGLWNGLLNTVVGVLMATIGTVAGLIMGFVQGIIGWFQHLSDVLVGHSIVPDMARAIIAVFLNLLSFMPTFGSNMVSMFGAAITGGLGNVFGPVMQLATGIKRFLGFHSPPESGPLADSNTYMPNMMSMFGNGITSNTGSVLGPINSLGSQMSDKFHYYTDQGQKTWAQMWTDIIATEQSQAGPAYTQMYTIGSDVVAGMVNGIGDNMGRLHQVIFQLTDTVKVATGSGLKISSPSQIFHYFGQMVVEGFINGILSGKNDVQTAADRAFSVSTNALQNSLNTARFQMTQAMAPGGIMVGAPPTFSSGAMSQTVNVHVGSQRLFQLVMNQLTGQMQMNGLGTAWR